MPPRALLLLNSGARRGSGSREEVLSTLRRLAPDPVVEVPGALEVLPSGPAEE